MVSILIAILTMLTFIRDTCKMLWNMTKGQVGYITDYRETIDGFKDEANNLLSRAKDLQISVDAAETRGEPIKFEVQNWQKKANEVQIEINELAEEIKKNRGGCFSGRCPDCCSRYKLGKRAEESKAKIHMLLQSKNLEVVSHPRAESSNSTVVILSDFQLFESTRVATEALMNALQDGEVDVIGVYGMGGVGKTYMVKHVETKAQEMGGLFDRVVMAVVSQTPSVGKIQGQIADKLGLKLKDDSETMRANQLNERLLRCEKQILVILDDIWELLDLTAVGIPKGKCKILLTTRRTNVCHVMGCQKKIPLDILSANDSWILFSRASGEVVGLPEFNAVAREVAAECGGLPIALVAVGRALGDKADLQVWKNAARRLKRSEVADPDDDGTVYKCIKLSYDFLKDQSGRHFFLICCLFPEDHNINEEDLSKYGMGLDLFPSVQTMQEGRDEAHAIVENLKGSCLLLDGDNMGSVKMHDVIRDMAIRIASEEHSFIAKAGLALRDWPRSHASFEECKAISLMWNDIRILPEERKECRVLEMLLLQDNRNLEIIPLAFFKGMKALKVLDLSRVNIHLLPSSLQLSTNLRTLCLDGCKMTDISIVGELKMLEILSLKKSSIEAFPDSFGQLANLRMLDLTLSNCSHIPPKVIPKLSRLEELFMRGSFAEWGYGGELETKASFHELLELPSLNVLQVDVHDVKSLPAENLKTELKWERFEICVSSSAATRKTCQSSKHKASRDLVLSIPIDKLPRWFKMLVTGKAERLNFYECRDVQNILVEYHQGRLTNLKSLSLNGCASVAHLMKVVVDSNIPSNEPVFKNLEKLYVNQMYIMKELCVGELPDGSLEELRFLEVQQCNFLVDTLLPSNLLRRIQNLEVLNVNGNSVQVVFGFEGLHGRGQVLTKLREMKLENLPKLTGIWKGPPNQIAKFGNLKVLIVIQCEKLRSLLAASTCQSLLKLEELQVEDCNGLEEIIQQDEEEATVLQSNGLDDIVEESATDKLIFPKLKTLSLRSLPKVTCFYAGRAALLECPELERMRVDDCPRFRTSPSNFNSKKHVQLIGELNSN